LSRVRAFLESPENALERKIQGCLKRPCKEEVMFKLLENSLNFRSDIVVFQSNLKIERKLENRGQILRTMQLCLHCTLLENSVVGA